jgi:alpha-ketoglutarate-dependent 2,4-dichlorophenoxyacetate dioxygenase
MIATAPVQSNGACKCGAACSDAKFPLEYDAIKGGTVMPLHVTPLTPDFCAEIAGVDITKPIAPEVFAEIRAAFDAYSVLVFHDQPMDDDIQTTFSKYFGNPEISGGGNPGRGTPFSRQSNLDIETGEPIPPDDRRIEYQKGNMLWHMDSSFKTVSSLCSVLTAREVPPEGGDTEFASTRLAYESLNDDLKAQIEDLEVDHDIRYSRGLTGFKYDDETAKKFVTARHKLVRTNAGNGRKSLLIGVHAMRIVGWPEDKSRALLDDLLERAERQIYRHKWRQDDVVVWDNQAAVHRATPFDVTKYRRFMQRTTISLNTAWPDIAAQQQGAGA